MGQHQHALKLSLDRLTRELAGQPEASVLEVLRNDPELATWGWTDGRLATWAHEIATNVPAVYAPKGAEVD